MTCYVRIQDEKVKKKQKELEEQQKKDAKKQHMLYELENKLYERRKQNAIARPDRIAISGADLHRLKRFGIPETVVVKPGAPETHMPGHGKHLSHLPIMKKAELDNKELPEYTPIGSTVHSHAGVEEDDGIVTLKAIEGLPVSLSVGQKNVRLLMVGKNETKKKLNTEFMASAYDFNKKAISLKAEPGKCTLEPGAEMQFKISFDLEDNVATGPMALSAYLRENAVYVDRLSAKSEAVNLTSEIKTPMELVYIASSCRFERLEGDKTAICLVFENKGESGGILSTKSSIGYGSDAGMLRAALPERAKVKGKQKKVELRFSPAQEVAVGLLALELLGADSNGKEYKLQKTIKEKK